MTNNSTNSNRARKRRASDDGRIAMYESVGFDASKTEQVKWN